MLKQQIGNTVAVVILSALLMLLSAATTQPLNW